MARTDDNLFAPDHPPATNGFLAKLANFIYNHKKLVLFSWIAGVIVLGVLSGALKGLFHADYSTPGSESKAAAGLIQQRFPGTTGDTFDVVWKADEGVKSPAAQKRMNALFAELHKQDGVGIIATPNAILVSKDGKIAQANIPLSKQGWDFQQSDINDLHDIVEKASGNGLQVEVGGQLANAGGSTPKFPGFIAAMLILLIAFGTVVASGLPIITAIFGLAVGSMLTAILAAIIPVPDWTPAVADLLGIGVGIDYALLVLTRFRDALDTSGGDVRASLVEALTTAGRSIVVAGTTVVVAVLGLFIVGVEYMRGVAVATSLTILVVMLTALTLMPALLAMLGERINKLKLPGVKTAHQRREQENDPDHLPLAARWSRQVQKRPWPMAVAATVVLLLLAAPALNLKLGFPDNSNLGKETTGYKSYALINQGFGAGANGPLLVAVDLKKAGGGAKANAPTLAKLESAIKQTPNVVSVTAPVFNAAGDAALVTVIPSGSPQSKATKTIVTDLRDDVIPAALNGTSATALVGGATPAYIDQSKYLKSRIPAFVIGILLLSLIVLLVAFRSPVIAVKATVMNLLSIGAAYGVITVASNGSAFGKLVGIDQATPVAPFLPVMMFAILFGLSMDYEVFLMSRVREEYLNGAETHDAVTIGLARTARVITAAAAIMVAVFLSFALAPDVFLRQMGVGMATAVFVDATIVRMILVPATLQILGKANWWIPGWLDRLLPKWDIERASQPATAIAD
jgi:RND superfamily putative drug exporter